MCFAINYVTVSSRFEGEIMWKARRKRLTNKPASVKLKTKDISCGN